MFHVYIERNSTTEFIEKCVLSYCLIITLKLDCNLENEYCGIMSVIFDILYFGIKWSEYKHLIQFVMILFKTSNNLCYT